MTRFQSYLSRPLGPGTPGVAWDASRLTNDGMWCWVHRETVKTEAIVSGYCMGVTIACRRADRTARRLARRKGQA